MIGEWLLHHLARKSCIIYVLIGAFSLFNSYPQNVKSQFLTPTFEYISSEDGLPENSVTCILQDHLGYLWLGTQNGLVRYDGYSMKVFQSDKNDSSSISNGSITTIYEDKNKTLWIGTWNGLNKFNRSNETFTSYIHGENDENSISNSWIKAIYEDDSGQLWIGTEGLNLFDTEKQIFKKYMLDDPGASGVNAIIKDPSSGDLLIGTSAPGLWRFNLKNKIFSKYKFSTPGIPDKRIGRIFSFYKSREGIIWMASSNSVSSLDPKKKECKSYIEFPLQAGNTFEKATVIEDQNGMIWCGFWHLDKGVFCLDPKSGFYKQYKLFPDNPENQGHNRVYSIYEDNSGIIWIGSWLSGLEKWDTRRYKFHVLKNDSKNPNSISDSKIYNLAYDPGGFIWFATPKALDKFDFNTGKFQHFLKNKDNINQNIYHLITDNSGDIWIGGTLPGGLMKFNPLEGSYRYYFNNTKDSLSLIKKEIIYLFQDHLGFLWIGTINSGLYKFDMKLNKLKHYYHKPNDPSSLSENRVNMIVEDSFGILWIGTNLGGLEKFDRDTEKFTYYGLSTIMYIFEDKKKNFWVADYFTGLNLLDRQKNRIIAHYIEKDGLANRAIQGILEDDHNNLWISTDVGLSKFSISEKTFKNYIKANGLPANRFFWPCCKDGNGIMYFKTEGGIIYFHPDSIKDDPVPPKVVLNRVSLFNRPGEKIEYEGFISNLKEITLPYNQNDLRFNYVGLQFSEPAKNQYKYILENFDKDWVDAGTQRNAVYTNLGPGKYIFRINAANKDGIWNKTGASIIIIITPPWWETTYAYFLYALIIISIIYVTWRLQLKRIRVKHEYEMSRFEAEKLHEVDELKSRFFTNISHEFRTPLTLILGPSEQIIERTKEEKTRDDLKVIHKNARSLLGLVNELLDISKLESGNMKLQASPQNIIPLLKALVQSFCSYAERKRINLKFTCNEDEIIVYIDKEKIEKIITNLLSNAFKFTPEEGKIEVSVTRSFSLSAGHSHPEFVSGSTIKPKILNQVQNDKSLPIDHVKYLQISISDNGIGIPKENISKIFDRFYQVNGSHTREKEGTGIGLALTKELVELHKGKIEVESEEGRGTAFIVSIPLGKEHLAPEEICDDKKVDTSYNPAESILVDENKIEKPVFKQIKDTDKPILLITEDNYDVRNYIKDNLKDEYQTLEAKDGEEGWKKAVENMPDLIISDVMMPKTDGFQLCNKLKKDERTSHIPIILLTAKATSEDKIEGFTIGADEYIMKPFDTSELKARIRNLIEQRKRVHDHLRRHGLIELDESKITNLDKKFLEKVYSSITENISDSSFNVEALADELAVNRVILHKKIVSLTGEPPVELIRRIRLLKASELIKNKFGNVSEIAFEVGFNNPAYFSECFKKQFGISPSQYFYK